MRLTVRTLLAWLDQVLPPEEQHELDGKVAASAPARQLAERIRRVVERPTIPAPRIDGRGLAADANSVAEYLDNCLDHDRLEAFERICIDSDMHLAEVAACHGLLATLARDPSATAPLDAAGRRRLLEAMGHQSAAMFGGVERWEAAENARALGSALTTSADGSREVVATPRRSSWGAWAAAISAVALLALLGAVLVTSVGRARAKPRGLEPADAPAVEAGPAAQPVEVVAPMPPPAEFDIVPPPAPAPRSEPPAAAVEAVADAPTPPPAAPPAMEEAPAAAAPATPQQPRVPQGDALAIAAPAVAPATAPPAVPAPNPAASAAAQDSLGFVAGEALLMRRVVIDDRPIWTPFAPGAALGSREDLIVPPGFLSDLNVRGVTIRLLPTTRAVVTADAQGVPRLEVVFGRAIVRASRPDATLGIVAGGLVGTITAGLVGPAAIAVDLDRDPGSDPAGEPTRVRASVIAVNNGIVWRQTSGDADQPGGALDGIVGEGMVEARTAIEWGSAAPGIARVTHLAPLPQWTISPPQIDKLQRSACAALAARVRETGALDQSLQEMAADRRVENRVLAASTLALLGDFDVAVELLCAESPGRRLEHRQWLALEAETVPLALARGANAAAKLRAALEDRGPPGKAATLFAMARGFSDEELAAGAAEELVAALDASDLVVRRYAIKCLCDIVQPAAADRLRYRPDGLPELRREGVAWWRGQLQKGLIRRHGAA